MPTQQKPRPAGKGKTGVKKGVKKGAKVKAVVRSKPGVKKAGRAKAPGLAGALTDLYGPIPRGPLPSSVPTPSEIDQALAPLPTADQAIVRQILDLVGSHLGSPEAARLWLVTPFTDFPTTPLREITEGGAAAVLAYLEGQWGPGAVYA